MYRPLLLQCIKMGKKDEIHLCKKESGTVDLVLSILILCHNGGACTVHTRPITAHFGRGTWLLQRVIRVILCGLYPVVGTWGGALWRRAWEAPRAPLPSLPLGPGPGGHRSGRSRGPAGGRVASICCPR